MADISGSHSLEMDAPVAWEHDDAGHPTLVETVRFSANASRSATSADIDAFGI